MCGRYANHIKKMDQWVDLLSDWPTDAELGYNIAPSRTIPVFTAEGGQAMRWGIVPSWSKEPTSKYATFNARTETVAEKPAFRGAWKRSQTCLVPALGYYEWQGEKGSKQPYFVRPEDDTPLVMAGLWELWQHAGDRLMSCTILTQPAGGKLASLHHRMPLFVDHDQAEQWINDGVTIFDSLIDNQNVDGLRFHAVGREVNSGRAEGEQLIAPAAQR